MKVQRLPKDARYDYTDVLGAKVYHTANRRYEVRNGIIYSFKK